MPNKITRISRVHVLMPNNRDVPVRVGAVRVVSCCLLDSPVRVEMLRVACLICRSVLSRCRVACWASRSVSLVACWSSRSVLEQYHENMPQPGYMF